MTERPSYLPALDGLRAVAVVAVLLYHGSASWAPGGFIGVDVFFVLSGYLITALLLAEHARWGAIDLLAFWRRRARRLLPALFLMLVAVAAYAAVLAPAGQRESIRLDALATLGYVANWRFVASGQSYFAQFQAPSPLRHTWSLGIEEQWYLLFPPMLALALSRWHPSRRLLSVALGALALASAALMAALFTPGADPSRVYFGTDTRVQALLVGAVVAVALRDVTAHGRWRLATRAGSVGGLLAVVLIVAVVRDSDAWMYRGGFLLTAIAAALVVVGVATRADGPVERLLTWAPLVQVGLISYGLYLWHWPVFVTLTPERTGLTALPLLVLRILVTTVIAAASYLAVEQPIRTGRWRAAVRPERFRAAVAATTVAVVVLVLGGTAGTVAAEPAVVQPPSTASTAHVNAFLLGDSVAYNLRTDFPASAVPDLRVTGSTELGCGLLPDTLTAEGKTIVPPPECAAWHRRMGAEVDASAPDIGVLLVGSWEQYDRIVGGRVLKLGTPEFERHVRDELNTLLALLGPSKRPVAVLNVPCHRTPDFGLGPEPHIVNDDERVRRIDKVVADFVDGAGPNVHLVDFDDFLCHDGYTATRGAVTLRTDGLHFTPAGARLIWGWLGPKLLAIDREPLR
jgi:peptidoglycan/LPS O-acetylase OafA/YrhL